MGFEDVPLRYRLPNPPTEFLGRGPDLLWLRDTLQHAPVALIAGPEGVGKTALACTVARELEPEFRGGLLAQANGERPLLEAARALAHCAGIELDWAPLLASGEQLTATAVDIAESGPWLVVLDGLSESRASEAGLGQLFRYARRARWLATARELPELPGYLEQCRKLAPLASAESDTLVQRLAPKLSRQERRALAAKAAGLPGVIRSALLRPHESGRTVEGISTSAKNLHGALRIAACSVPVKPNLERVAGELEELQRSGLLVRTHDDVVVPASDTAACVPDAKSLLLVAQALAQAAGSDERNLGALRSALAAGDESMCSEVFDSLGDGLIAKGYAGEVLQLLESQSPLPRGLYRHRLACLSELGADRNNSLIGLPEDASAQERLEWAKLHSVRGEFDEAKAAAVVAFQDAAESTTCRFEAALLLVRLAALAGSPREQLEWLRRADPGDRDQRVRVEVRLAQCHIALGDVAEAKRLAESLISDLESVTPRTARDVRYGIAHVLYVLGELRRAREVLSPNHASARQGSLGLHPERRLLTFRAVLSLDTGQLDECSTLLRRLEPYVPSGSAHAPFVEVIVAQLELARGQLGRAKQRIDELTELARVKKSGLLLGSLQVLAERLALLIGPGHSVPTQRRDDLTPVAPFDDLYRVQRALRMRRWGQPDLEYTLASNPVVEVQLRKALLDATTELVHGQLDAAQAASRALAKRAGDLGFFWIEVEALKLVSEAQLALEAPDELSRALHGLSRLADASSSPALADDVALLSLGCVAADPAEVERLATHSCSAEVRRRARALLGEAVELDALDQLIVRALRRHGIDVVTLGPGRRREGWGIDERTQSVWSSDGSHHDLSRRPRLWRLLGHLVKCREATKEALAAVLWPDEPYHPLKHDNRLQAQVRQLRRVIEEDPAAPVRLLTTAEGYALGSEEALRHRPALITR